MTHKPTTSKKTPRTAKEFTRRTVLKGSAAAGVVAVTGCATGSGGKCGATKRRQTAPGAVKSSTDSNLSKFDHIVVLMLENHSLDSLAGYLYDGANKPDHIIGRGGPEYRGVAGKELSNSVTTDHGKIIKCSVASDAGQWFVPISVHSLTTITSDEFSKRETCAIISRAILQERWPN